MKGWKWRKKLRFCSCLCRIEKKTSIWYLKGLLQWKATSHFTLMCFNIMKVYENTFQYRHQSGNFFYKSYITLWHSLTRYVLCIFPTVNIWKQIWWLIFGIVISCYFNHILKRIPTLFTIFFFNFTYQLRFTLNLFK